MTTEIRRNSVKAEVKRLLSEGKKLARNESGAVEKEICLYGKALHFLVEEVFAKQFDEELENEISQLVPPSSLLKSKFANELKGLGSSKVSERLKAADFIQDEVNGFVTAERQLWLMHPQTKGRLIEVLQNETDQKVQEKIICALGGIHFRYVPDSRIADAIIPFFSSSNSNVVRATVIATRSVNCESKWRHVLLVASGLKSKKMLTAVLLHCYHVPHKYQVEFMTQLFGYLEQNRTKLEMGLAMEIVSSICGMYSESSRVYFHELCHHKWFLQIVKKAVERDGHEHILPSATR